MFLYNAGAITTAATPPAISHWPVGNDAAAPVEPAEAALALDADADEAEDLSAEVIAIRLEV